MRKQVGWLVLALIVVATILFYSRRRQKTVQRVVIAQAGDFFLYAPLYVALDAGLFQAQGLDVSLISTGGDDKTWAAVTSGSASFGIADPTFVVVSSQRGQPGKVVASVVNGVPFWGITLRNDVAPLPSPHALAGHTVATFSAPSTAFALQTKMFKDAGLEPSIRQGAFGTLLAMLQAGQADIALELEPNVSQAVANGAQIVYSMGNLYRDFAITGLTTTPGLLMSERPLVSRVTCALQQSLDYIHQRPDNTLSFLAKRFPEIARSVAADALSRVTKEQIVPTSVVIGEPAWDKAVNLRVSIGDIQDPGPFQEYVDMSVATEAFSACRLERR